MNERNDKGILLLKSNKYYNKKIHYNHSKSWTTKEIKLIMEDDVHTLTELGELIGRSPASISQKRSENRKNKKRPI